MAWSTASPRRVDCGIWPRPCAAVGRNSKADVGRSRRSSDTWVTGSEPTSTRARPPEAPGTASTTSRRRWSRTTMCSPNAGGATCRKRPVVPICWRSDGAKRRASGHGPTRCANSRRVTRGVRVVSRRCCPEVPMAEPSLLGSCAYRRSWNVRSRRRSDRVSPTWSWRIPLRPSPACGICATAAAGVRHSFRARRRAGRPRSCPAGRRLLDQIEVDGTHWSLAEARPRSSAPRRRPGRGSQALGARRVTASPSSRHAGEAIDPLGAVTGGSEAAARGDAPRPGARASGTRGHAG